MKTGVNASEANIAKVFLDSYKEEEHKIYFPIASAFKAKKTEKVKELILEFNADQRTKLKKYVGDWDKAQKADPKQLMDYFERMLQEMNNMKQKLDNDIKNSVDQKSELITQFAIKEANKLSNLVNEKRVTEKPSSHSFSFKKPK